MSDTSFKDAAVFIREDLRLKTFPVAARFLKKKADIPEKARRPSVAMGKRIAVCQGVTMARNYGWTIALTREDVICVPAAIAFGFSDSLDQAASIAKLFCGANFSSTADIALKETSSMSRFQNGEIEAILLAPLEKAFFEPETVIIYGNPAQMMRLIQAWSYKTGERLSGEFGGKLECDEYLISPFKMQRPRIVIPGNGERIFAATQDDEMAFAIPAKDFLELTKGLGEVGRAIGARYPMTPYQNFEPDFPKHYKEVGKEVGVL